MALNRGVVGVIVGIAITMLIGIIVISSLISSVNTSGWSTEAQNTWSSLTSNIWTALGLLVILPLIVGAVILLKYIGGSGSGL